ncbi:hypothetical protein [uncultured Butyricimonas sp.]|uniref:hypothetical protein n=1 Tax=uncultured Butyricimonas sp. TaxID=1268785 RepID=UPI0026DC574C|nr:hypothetical protein [uncultured Butyricimonas sp.]
MKIENDLFAFGELQVVESKTNRKRSRDTAEGGGIPAFPLQWHFHFQFSINLPLAANTT